MTPKRLAAWLQLAERRRAGEQADAIEVAAFSGAEPRSVRRAVKKLRDET